MDNIQDVPVFPGDDCIAFEQKSFWQERAAISSHHARSSPTSQVALPVSMFLYGLGVSRIFPLLCHHPLPTQVFGDLPTGAIIPGLCRCHQRNPCHKTRNPHVRNAMSSCSPKHIRMQLADLLLKSVERALGHTNTDCDNTQSLPHGPHSPAGVEQHGTLSKSGFP